MQEILFIIGFS